MCEDRAALERAHGTAEMRRLLADGALFIDGIKTLLVEEKQIIPAA